MTNENADLGKVKAVFAISPAYLQRVVFIIVLSFMFFLAMMFAYYIRQNFLYFLLSTAFLLVYLVTLFGFMMSRKTVVSVFDNGFEFKKQTVSWKDIESISDDGKVSLLNSKAIALPSMIANRNDLIDLIRQRSPNSQ